MARQIEYFTSSGRRILRMAQNSAIRLQHDTIRPDHILLAMTRATDTNAYFALQDVDIIEGKLAQYLSKVRPPKKNHPLRFEGVEFATASQELFRVSLIDATMRGNDYIASANLLMGMMRLQDPLIADILKHFALERKEVIKATEYYFEHSIEVEKHRIPVSVEDDPIGCIALIQDVLSILTRRR